MTFAGVPSDSRCPVDVVCIWAGDAIVRLTLLDPGSGRVERELHTDPQASETTFAGRTVRLVELAPYPQAARATPQNEYHATLVVN